MSALPTTAISPAEYLRRERLAETRSEYHRGQIVAMSGTTINHNLIGTNLVRTLGNQLIDRPCKVFSNDLRVSIRGGEHYVYPDVIVTCGAKRWRTINSTAW